MSRSKKQGTAFETAIVNMAEVYDLWAQRLPEGGRRDRGDVEIMDNAGLMWTVEAKACERLSLHQTWRRAQEKAGVSGSTPVVAWKRVTLKNGNSRRSADGPALVAVPLQMFLKLLRERGYEYDAEGA